MPTAAGPKALNARAAFQKAYFVCFVCAYTLQPVPLVDPRGGGALSAGGGGNPPSAPPADKTFSSAGGRGRKSTEGGGRRSTETAGGGRAAPGPAGNPSGGGHALGLPSGPFGYPVADAKEWAKRFGPALAASLAMIKAACVLAKVSRTPKIYIMITTLALPS